MQFNVIISDPVVTTLQFICPLCGKTYTYQFNIATLINGVLLQNAFPELTPSEREYLKTGICNECWHNKQDDHV